MRFDRLKKANSKGMPADQSGRYFLESNNKGFLLLPEKFLNGWRKKQ